MRLAALSPGEVRDRLAGDGLVLRLGRFAARARSTVPELAASTHALYAHHELGDDDTVCDFDVDIRPSGGIRRFWHPQVRFYSDGVTPFHPLPRDQAAAFLEWGLNWCIANHVHDLMVIHAAVLAKGDRAVILPAPSGGGKSTLAAALAFSGWRLLSDELTLLDLETLDVVALARPINLKNRSIDIMRDRCPDGAFAGLAEETIKGRVTLLAAPEESVIEVDRPARAHWIVLPRYTADAPSEHAPLSPPRALVELARNAMNYSIHGRRGFDALCRLVDTARASTLVYSDLDEAIAIMDRMADGEQG